MSTFRTTLCIVLALSAPALAHAEHESGKWDCSGTQLDMNYCAAARFKHVDDELNALYRRQLDRLETAATKSRFRDSQRAWLAFRDKSCLYQAGPREESGSTWPLENFSCMEYHTKQRLTDLKHYLACTQNGCPN